MRILLISNLFPPDIGGPATHISRLASELYARGHRVRVIVCADNPRISSSEPYSVHRISRRLPVPFRFTIVFFWTWLSALFSDVVYINGLELPATAGARLAFRSPVLKIVGDFSWEYAIRHGWTDDGIDDYQSANYPKKVELVRLVQKLYCRLAGRIIVPSNYLQSLVAGWGIPESNITVINNSLVEEVHSNQNISDVRLKLGISGPLVLTVARLYPWKQVDDLIRMTPHLSDEAVLVIVGDGPERGLLETLALDLDAQVVFVGAVAQQDVYSYLAAADVFVLNTRYEGMSHVLLEARRAGAPIVTTNVGGNVEILDTGRNGLLVPYGDRSAMIAAINQILEDRDLADRLGNNARDGMDRYSWDRQVTETLQQLCASAST